MNTDERTLAHDLLRDAGEKKTRAREQVAITAIVVAEDLSNEGDRLLLKECVARYKEAEAEETRARERYLRTFEAVPA